MKYVILPFMLLAGVGFVCCLLLHIGSLLGVLTLAMENVSVLFIVVFIVWIPTILAARHVSKDFKQKDFWKAALRGCPKWMRILAYSTFGYAIVNFIV